MEGLGLLDENREFLRPAFPATSPHIKAEVIGIARCLVSEHWDGFSVQETLPVLHALLGELGDAIKRLDASETMVMVSDRGKEGGE